MNLNTAGSGRLRHGLRDRAHAADGVTPRALLAVDLPEHVMQQDVGGARGIGTGIVADDAVEAVHGLDGIALEPTLQIIAGRDAEQAQQLASQRHVEFREAAADARRVQQLGEGCPPAAGHDIGWRLENQAPQ